MKIINEKDVSKYFCPNMKMPCLGKKCMSWITEKKGKGYCAHSSINAFLIMSGLDEILEKVQEHLK